MAANPTRMLVLGIVSLFEPANGYQLQRELMSWNIDYWANVKPGSIYSMLSTLTKQDMLVRHVLPDGEREVRVYTMTDAGHEELHRLIRDGIETVSAMDPTGFRVALSLSPGLGRDEFLSLVERRAETVATGEADLEQVAAEILGAMNSPPHVGYSLRLESRLLGAESQWLRELIEVVRSGGLHFSGEASPWAPPAGDPGWLMDSQRSRYRQQLAGD